MNDGVPMILMDIPVQKDKPPSRLASVSKFNGIRSTPYSVHAQLFYLIFSSVAARAKALSSRLSVSHRNQDSHVLVRILGLGGPREAPKKFMESCCSKISH